MRGRLGMLAAALSSMIFGRGGGAPAPAPKASLPRFDAPIYQGGNPHRCYRVTCECGAINTRVLPTDSRSLRCRGCQQKTSLKFAES